MEILFFFLQTNILRFPDMICLRTLEMMPCKVNKYSLRLQLN